MPVSKFNTAIDDQAGSFLAIEQTLALYDGWRTSLFANVLTACLTIAVLSPVLPFWQLGIWLTLCFIIVIVRLGVAMRFDKTDISVKNYQKWLNAMMVLAFISGIPWILAAIFFLSPEQPAYSLLLSSIFSGSLAASALSWSAHQRSYLVFAIPTACAFVFCYMLMGTAFAYSVAILIIGFLLIMSMFTQSAERTLLESKRLNFENLELVAAITKQKEKAEKAFEIKTQFLAAASHDLRQPLHASSMFVEALQNLPLPDEAKSIVGKLQQSTDAQGSLLHSLLDISRLDANVVEYHPAQVMLKPLLQRLCNEAKQSIANSEVELRLSVDERISVESDSVLLGRILSNLIDNAAKFTEAGYIEVTAHELYNGNIEINVKDSGQGIPDDMQKAVFREFVQLHNAERDRRRGLGLGLAIVARLCNLMNIKISLDSEIGEGTVFHLYLPNGERILNQEITKEVASDLTGHVIVIIDDERDILEATQKSLAQSGAEIIVAEDTHSAIESLMELDLEPTLIVSDLRLADDKNGIDGIQQLRDEYNTDAPALLLTGDTSPDRLQLAKRSRLEVMHKPISGEQLKTALSRLAQQ